MKNVITDTGDEIELGGFDAELFNILKKKLPNFKDYLFIVYGNNDTKLPLTRLIQHDKKILIWRSNENKLNRIDDVKKHYKHIFANYHWSEDNCKSLQLGYHTQTKNNKVIPMNERLFNITFTGCLNRNRIKIASILTNIKTHWVGLGLLFRKKLMLKIINNIVKFKYPVDYYQFNDGFNNGLNEEDYNFILRNTKIALCPKGWVNSETFRLYEAMKWGCIVISEQLPEREYYKGIPIIKVTNWNEGLKIANELKHDSKRLEAMSKEIQRYYKQHLSPEAGAELIIKTINNSNFENLNKNNSAKNNNVLYNNKENNK
jgi:glycosyltransferase involved in cell wall biosynthesis